jgi:uncharacterized protein YcgI (DUF1989 family)
MVESVTLARGTARDFPLKEGDEIKTTSPGGGQGGDFTFLGFDQALTRNINGWEKSGSVKLSFYADPGMKLYDGDGVAYLEVVEVQSDGRVDIMYPGCWQDIRRRSGRLPRSAILSIMCGTEGSHRHGQVLGNLRC